MEVNLEEIKGCLNKEICVATESKSSVQLILLLPTPQKAQSSSQHITQRLSSIYLPFSISMFEMTTFQEVSIQNLHVRSTANSLHLSAVTGSDNRC
jgi:hypothetical protein